jgi:hypothetical protein
MTENSEKEKWPNPCRFKDVFLPLGADKLIFSKRKYMLELLHVKQPV